MIYSDRLKCWAVVRLLPKMQCVVMARFVKESDADGYATVLRRLLPDAVVEVVFDLMDGNHQDDHLLH
ncbi:hypothetical protein H6F43_01605 [Leptolyngbya sp. FACHB-36]|uniref:hypothetical protein n=1 Tax=Leptolyngbya sp. FACHB-36 TaxID=2692808 RepID=UPI0016813692|nr:hypothetical protein [Leptolyngbya sp. FACHB-36]MBD2018881.1 hypothetical protein [Leptolyngbya sp. FACHB-36]